jgi:hypothetical protein
MEIIFDGLHDDTTAEEHLLGVLRLFKERYHIDHFREMRLSITLMDKNGADVELVDSQTSEVYRTFEIHQSPKYLKTKKKNTSLKLVVDNTPQNPTLS